MSGIKRSGVRGGRGIAYPGEVALLDAVVLRYKERGRVVVGFFLLLMFLSSI